MNLLGTLLCRLNLCNDIFNNVIGLFLGAKKTIKESLGPDNAVNHLLWFLTNCAHWETLIFWTIYALVTGSLSFANRNTLSLMLLNENSPKLHNHLYLSQPKECSDWSTCYSHVSLLLHCLKHLWLGQINWRTWSQIALPIFSRGKPELQYEDSTSWSDLLEPHI